ncbi:MAG: acyltransferase domain-containing protein, partial [bacterium]|nr:acyltransferase domain-containing protein [bacterium]
PPSSRREESEKGGDKTGGALDESGIAQLTVFIFEYALARLLMKWGIKPEAMIGYSFGEYATACIAGVFSLEDALKLVVLRGNLVKRIPVGSMLSVPLTREELTPLITGKISLAVDNGTTCIVAGPGQAVGTFRRQLKQKRYMAIEVPNTHAFHSSMMEPILGEFAAKAGRLSPGQPVIPYISNVTGTWITEKELHDPLYWAKHIRNTVQFADGIGELLKEENCIFLEVGPAGALSILVNQMPGKTKGHRTINLIRHRDEVKPDIDYLLNRIRRLRQYGLEIETLPRHEGTSSDTAPGKRIKKEIFSSIEPAEKKEFHILSAAQKRLYFLWQLQPESTVYNVPQGFPLGEETEMER